MVREEDKISLNSNSRRDFLKTTGVCCATLLAADMLPAFVSGARAEAGRSSPVGGQSGNIKAGNIKEVMRNYFGDRKISMAHVNLKVPFIAEDGAVVPVRIVTDLPMEKANYVQKMYIFVDENSNPFIASANFTAESGSSDFKLKIKMRKSSNVRAVAEMVDGTLYGDIEMVKVTIGGCGG